MTPNGPRAIEEFAVGDAITSRDEFQPGGEIEVKHVEEVFRRTAPILNLHVAGQVIRTTGEHPFFVYNKGWLKASALIPGDRLLCADGQWVPVEEMLDTGEWEVVYNLRIADYHTYFVCDWNWGFSVWSHNTNALCEGTAAINAGPIQCEVGRDNRNYRIRYQGAPSNSQFGPHVYRILEISGPIARTQRGDPIARRAQGYFQDYLGSHINGSVTPNNYDAGHLIGATLGGPNASQNLVPMRAPTNQNGGYFQMEDWLRKVLNGEVAPGVGQARRAPAVATMNVQVDYPPVTATGFERFVPTRFRIRVTLDSHIHDFSLDQTQGFTPPGHSATAPNGYW